MKNKFEMNSIAQPRTFPHANALVCSRAVCSFPRLLRGAVGKSFPSSDVRRRLGIGYPTPDNRVLCTPLHCVLKSYHAA